MLKINCEQGIENMTDIQIRYKKAQKLYLILLAALLALIFAFVYIAPSSSHKITLIKGVMYLLLLLDGIAMYMVMRCPKCRAFLMPAYTTAWGRLKSCPDCGVELIEN